MGRLDISNLAEIGHRRQRSAWPHLAPLVQPPRGEGKFRFLAGFILIWILTPILSGCWGSPSSSDTGTFDYTAIAIDPITPTTIYVGTNGGGVFRSTDGGGSWIPINQGLIDLKVTALAIDWNTPSRIYAGTEDGGIFSSFDYGDTWAAPVAQVPIINIRAIVIDRNFCPPTPPCRGVYVASQTDGVWRSIDGGLTYSQFNESLSNSAVTAMTMYPTIVPNPISRLYIGTEGGGVFLRAIYPTLDPQWTETSPGLKVLTQEEPVSIAVNPQNVLELYIGTSGGGEASSGNSGIYQSNDSGTTFNLVYDPKFKYTIYFVVPVIGPKTTDLTLYAGSDGIVRSVDNGGFWCILWNCSTPLEVLQPGLTAFAVADFTDTTIVHSTFYAALFNRQFIMSTDAGETWTTLSVQ